MSSLEEAKFLTTCPITNYKETVYCYFSRNPLVIIPNGCENSNGSIVCQNCNFKIYEKQLKLLSTLRLYSMDDFNTPDGFFQSLHV